MPDTDFSNLGLFAVLVFITMEMHVELYLFHYFRSLNISNTIIFIMRCFNYKTTFTFSDVRKVSMSIQTIFIGYLSFLWGQLAVYISRLLVNDTN